MSKGRVWNKGKRNGGGGPPEGSKSKAASTANNNSTSTETEAPVTSEPTASETRINTVKRMNRENWVERPARVTPKQPRND